MISSSKLECLFSIMAISTTVELSCTTVKSLESGQRLFWPMETATLKLVGLGSGRKEQKLQSLNYLELRKMQLGRKLSQSESS